jgi:hypothetical protein
MSFICNRVRYFNLLRILNRYHLHCLLISNITWNTTAISRWIYILNYCNTPLYKKSSILSNTRKMSSLLCSQLWSPWLVGYDDLNICFDIVTSISAPGYSLDSFNNEQKQTDITNNDPYDMIQCVSLLCRNLKNLMTTTLTLYIYTKIVQDDAWSKQPSPNVIGRFGLSWYCVTIHIPALYVIRWASKLNLMTNLQFPRRGYCGTPDVQRVWTVVTGISIV